MTAGNAILIVAIVTGLGLIGALFFVMFKIRQISREFFGTSSLIEGLKPGSAGGRYTEVGVRNDEGGASADREGFPGVSLAGVEAEV